MGKISSPHHPDFISSCKLFFKPKAYAISDIISESEGLEYAAMEFSLNSCRVKFRSAKITPKKIGQFVTQWKRNSDGITEPFSIEDPIEYYIICARNSSHFGLFVFPRNVLCEKGILSKEGKGGKRGYRIYPPWDSPNNKQAQRTQAWQREYFYSCDSLDEDLLLI
jgi:hypothetical protein